MSAAEEYRTQLGIELEVELSNSPSWLFYLIIRERRWRLAGSLGARGAPELTDATEKTSLGARGDPELTDAPEKTMVSQ